MLPGQQKPTIIATVVRGLDSPFEKNACISILWVGLLAKHLNLQ
jgi:hypothetical protein